MAHGVRNSWQGSALLRRDSEVAREALDTGGPLRFSVGGRFSTAELRQRTEPVVFEPSPVHCAGGRRYSDAQERPEKSARAALRHRCQWMGAGRWLDSYSSAGSAKNGI